MLKNTSFATSIIGLQRLHPFFKSVALYPLQCSQGQLHSNRFCGVSTSVSKVSDDGRRDDKKLIDDVLTYWYGSTTFEKLNTYKHMTPKWYMGGEQIDDEIRQTFGQHIQMGLAGKYDHFIDNTQYGVKSDVALVVLLDQFTRNMYRGSGKAFSGDSKSRQVVSSILQPHRWVIATQELPPLIRMSFMLVLMHQESMHDQHLCVKTIDDMIEEFNNVVKANGKEYENRKDEVNEYVEMLQASKQYAEKHRNIISKFGRYPHRNEALNRMSTKEEKEYLKDADRFGQ